jgi:hypothetical protein
MSGIEDGLAGKTWETTTTGMTSIGVAAGP